MGPVIGPTDPYSASVTAALTGLLGPGLPHPFRRPPGERITTAGLERQLAFELAVVGEPTWIQRPSLDRGEHSAAGLMLVLAVSEAAARSKVLDVGERGRDAAVVSGEREAAQARGVDEATSCRHDEQLTYVRGVSPPAIARSYRTGLHSLLTEEPVHDRGLARTGRSEQYGGPVRLQRRRDLFEPLPGDHARSNNIDPDQPGAQPIHDTWFREIALRHEHDRKRAAVPRHRDLSLDPTRAEPISGSSDKHVVDIRGEDLCRPFRVSACQLRPAIHDRDDGRLTIADPQVDPVANGDRQRSTRRDRAIGGRREAAGTLDAHDPARNTTLRCDSRVALRDSIAPAEGRERVHHPSSVAPGSSDPPRGALTSTRLDCPHLRRRLDRRLHVGGHSFVIALVTDSNAMLPGWLAERWDITVVPLRAVVAGETLIEDADLDFDAFFAQLRGGASVTTSAPPPGDFATAYEALAQSGALDIVSIHVGSAYSGTVNAARLAASMVDMPVYIVDSGTASFALGCCVWSARDARAAGDDVAAIVVAASRPPTTTTSVFTIGEIARARAGGRFDVAAVMLCYASAFALLGAAGVAAGRGVAFIAGLGCAAGIAAYHYTLIRERDRMRCFRAFLHNNWVGAAIFAGLAADYLLFPPQ